MKRNPFETILGTVVLGAAIAFLIFAMTKIDTAKITGYDVNVIFSKAGGLVAGTDVRISGIKVGTVSKIALDNDYMANVTLTIKDGVKLPKDSVAIISSEGLMGGKFVTIAPGKEKEVLAKGEKIKKTKEFKSLEDTVGELIFLATHD